jgi:osmotically-inducible protein OsmY
MKISRTLLAGAAGAAGAWFFDPQNGARRRNVTQDRIAAFFRRRKREAERQARYAEGVAHGIQHKAAAMTGQANGHSPEELNDETLAEKVKSEIFRSADSPKGKVSVNVENGVVFLRGELKRPEDIEEIVKATQAVDGVTQVESLLHTPGTPAPTK